MNFVIEKLTSDQIPQFHQVFCQVLREGFCYSPETIEYFINTAYSVPNFRYWLSCNYKGITVAREAKEIIGYLVYDSPYGGVLFCRWLGVLKQYRKQGFASKLFDGFISIAESLKCHKVEVAAQVPARGFYQKYGLTEEGFRKKSYFGIDQYLFGKVLE